MDNVKIIQSILPWLQITDDYKKVEKIYNFIACDELNFFQLGKCFKYEIIKVNPNCNMQKPH